MKYYFRIFASRGFKNQPIRTILRSVHLSVLLLLKLGGNISVRIGSKSFVFRYQHGERHAGGRGLFIYREQIEDLLAFGDQFLRVGDVVIDGGANQGVFTTAFAKYVAPLGRVIAIEPMAYAGERIKANADCNGLSEHISVLTAALSDKTGEAELDISQGVGSASITNDYGPGEKVKVPTVTIDQIVREFEVSRVDFIKLDIEGAELKALHGARNTIERFRPNICMEISDGSGNQVEIEAHHHLLSLNYVAFEFKGTEFVKLEAIKPPHANIFYLSKAV